METMSFEQIVFYMVWVVGVIASMLLILPVFSKGGQRGKWERKIASAVAAITFSSMIGMIFAFNLGREGATSLTEKLMVTIFMGLFVMGVSKEVRRIYYLNEE